MPTPISLQKKFDQGLDFAAYLSTVKSLVAADLTSGADQKGEHIQYTKLNAVRMDRVLKTTVLNHELLQSLGLVSRPVNWLVLTESWCGDAAQINPVLARIAEVSPLIALRFIFRDEHLDLMDNYLTGSRRSIPKMICFDPETGEEIAVWGPRPSPLQQYVMEMKAEGVIQPELGKNIQLWYAKDKTTAIQAELHGLIASFGRIFA